MKWRPNSGHREAYGGQVLNVLERLNAEIERVRVQAGGYPATTIAGDVWFDGVGYANLASALTQHFNKAGWLKHEHNASLLWAKATLAVCSHYHHLVGPAMIANADCQERLGNAGRAQMYAGVAQDFLVVLDGCDEDADSPTDDNRIAIESLRTAVVRLLAMGENEAGSISLAGVLSRADEVLSREQR